MRARRMHWLIAAWPTTTSGHSAATIVSRATSCPAWRASRTSRSKTFGSTSTSEPARRSVRSPGSRSQSAKRSSTGRSGREGAGGYRRPPCVANRRTGRPTRVRTKSERAVELALEDEPACFRGEEDHRLVGAVAGGVEGPGARDDPDGHDAHHHVAEPLRLLLARVAEQARETMVVPVLLATLDLGLPLRPGLCHGRHAVLVGGVVGEVHRVLARRNP